jgi:hypothetical protein
MNLDVSPFSFDIPKLPRKSIMKNGKPQNGHRIPGEQRNSHSDAIRKYLGMNYSKGEKKSCQTFSHQAGHQRRE